MSTPYTPAPVVLRAPEGTNPSTGYFWAIVVLSAVICIPSFILLATIDMTDMLRQSLENPSDPLAMYGFMFTPAYLGSIAAGFVGYAGTIVLAYLDWRTLAARGVPKLFHWAFSAIPSYGTYVYVIGRAVVVRRRTGGGLAPLWVFVALQAVVFILSLALTFAMMASMFAGMEALIPTYR